MKVARCKKMKVIERQSLWLWILILCFVTRISVVSVSEQQLDQVIEDTAIYMHKTVSNPQVGFVGGEWAVLGLARSDYHVPNDYYLTYYNNVETYVKEKKGVLHHVKLTEYSRLILALTASGYDPRNVGGYDLTYPLSDFDKTIQQGINGPIFALIALDSGAYTISDSDNPSTQATRDKYVDEILRRQLEDGGFSLFGGLETASSKKQVSDPDITAMALQALAKYQKRNDVKKVIDEALDFLSNVQNDEGGYSSWGKENVESTAQVAVALTELGVSVTDKRFVKNGKTVVDNLLEFYTPGEGFLHTEDGTGVNQMATEQAFYALVAIQRAQQKKQSLYRMTDVEQRTKASLPSTSVVGKKDKHPDVQLRPVVLPKKTFDDIKGHRAKLAMDSLAARQIIQGKTQTEFKPNMHVTRSEFATMIVQALGLPKQSTNQFRDVPAKSWYATSVGAAYNYGIIHGQSRTVFNPNGTITREEAAVMIARAAKLTGNDTDVSEVQMRDMLAQFSDYMEASQWARTSLAFCYQSDLLSQQDLTIRPREAIKRYEVAQMLYNLLDVSQLL